MVRQCFEVLHDCGEVELVARPRQPSQSHTLKAMMGLEVGKPHLDFLALVARFVELRRTHQCAGEIASILVGVTLRKSIFGSFDTLHMFRHWWPRRLKII